MLYTNQYGNSTSSSAEFHTKQIYAKPTLSLTDTAESAEGKFQREQEKSSIYPKIVPIEINI